MPLKQGVFIVVPVLNAARDWPAFAPPLLLAVPPDKVLVIDSSSTDETESLVRTAGFRLKTIAREEFNHANTRQMAAEMLPEAEILVYLTQDAILADPAAIDRLVAAFDDPMVGAAYGRQLPRPGAGAIEAHARLFNYSIRSDVRDLNRRSEMGIKTLFFSNSFGAYRRSALFEQGGFPRDSVFGEDAVISGRLLLAGWKVAYVSEAAVYHSHSYTHGQDFKRYFDIGEFHRRESKLFNEFGNAGGEGKRFLLSELGYLWRNDKAALPSALLRTGLKLAAYRLGMMRINWSPKWRRRLSMYSKAN